MEGIEPTTPRLQITCSGQLSYIGNFVPFLSKRMQRYNFLRYDLHFVYNFLWLQNIYNEKSTEEIQCFCAPLTIEMLNLWNDFRKVVKFIDENPWVKPMLERIVENKKTEG